MPITLPDYEKRLARRIQEIQPCERIDEGSLLRVVPGRVEWEDFLVSVRHALGGRPKNLTNYPSCLLVLYCGLAFYEYEENTFWPQFAKCVGVTPMSPNAQSEINGAFAIAAQRYGLVMRARGNGTDFVGSAVRYVGIPLSLWEGFLDVCEWALWRKDWEALPDDEWASAVEKRTRSRQRLGRFLVQNRDSTSRCIKEMIDARQILEDNPSWTVSNVAQASFLRQEYFEEVPETAEFLRPKDPNSLISDRARIVWDEQRRQIHLQLPGVVADKLPASWYFGNRSQGAAGGPDRMAVNAAAFQDPLVLTLRSGQNVESQSLRGLVGWGLFDAEDGGRLVNSRREDLPLKSYVIVSLRELEILSREGFDIEDSPANERFELADGTICFTTRLWPVGHRAEVRLRPSGGPLKTLRFRPRARIEARFFVGWGRKAGYFDRVGEKSIKMDHLPTPCVSIPVGYFEDNVAELAGAFRLQINGNRAHGSWVRHDVAMLADREFYCWQWSRAPYLEARPGVPKITTLKRLGDAFRAPDLRGRQTIAIEARQYVRDEIQVEIVSHSGIDINIAWRDLPGAFLPMFLLCQEAGGMTWEELLVAREVIAPRQHLSPYLLHKYAREGFLRQQGRRWVIGASRAEFSRMDADFCKVNYCGDPSILWGLYRRLRHEMSEGGLPVIKVINSRGDVPYLQMSWPQRLSGLVCKFLKGRGVSIGPTKWTH